MLSRFCLSAGQVRTTTDWQGKGPATRPPPGGNFTEAPPPAPVDESTTTPAQSTSAIHPSRLQAIEQAPPAHAYGAPSVRGGRGRGGFAAPVAPRGGRGFGRNAGVTGENKVAPPGGMRSWGSTPLGGSPVPEAQAQAPTVLTTPAVPIAVTNGNMNGGEKKKKGKKGDKGGTGSNAGKKAPHNQALASSNANSNSETVIVAPGPPTTTTTTEDGEGASKKRKRDESAIPTTTTTGSSEPSEKVLKRLRKNVSKLEGSETISLQEYLGRVGKGKKDEVIDRDTLLAGLKVGLEGGKWVLSV